MTNNLKKLIEQIIDEETVKLDFPWKKWTLNKENSPFFMSLYRKQKDDKSTKVVNKFLYEPDGIVAKEVSEQDGSGIWTPTPATQYNTPITRKSIITLDFDNQRFFIETNLNDPRIAYVIKSTIETFPELSNFYVSKIKWDDSDSYNKVDFEDFGTAKDLVAKIKISKGTYSAYNKYDDEDRFEEFEYFVFRELNEETWYHTTKESNVSSILKKGLLTSHTFDQGTGWTQFNFNLQNAVYLTSNLNYARQIAETLTIRFGENAAIIEVNGKALQDFSKIATDEDILRDDFDGIVRSFDKEGFTTYLKRIPEVIESVANKINSIGYKDKISPEYLRVEEIMEAEIEDNFGNELKESIKHRNTKNFLAVLNYKSRNNIK